MSEETCDRCRVSVTNSECGVFCPACDDAMHAAEAECYRLREKLSTCQLMLDAIEGLATGQPGADPTEVGHGWSTALAAVKAVVAERDRLREILRRIASMDQPDTCVDCSTLYPGDGASWCWFCTAREALGEVKP